jgi:hypothetical protein
MKIGLEFESVLKRGLLAFAADPTPTPAGGEAAPLERVETESCHAVYEPTKSKEKTGIRFTSPCSAFSLDGSQLDSQSARPKDHL